MPEDIVKLPPNPFESVGLYTKYVSFGWLNGLFKKGYKRPLSNEDFYQVPKDDSSKHVTDKLERCWDKEQQSAKRSNRKPKLYKAVVRYLGTGYLFIAMGFLLEELMRIVMPYFIGRFISYFVPGTQTTRLQAYLYASVIILFQFGTAFIHHPNFFYFTRYGMQLKVCLGTLVFKKAMQLSQSACAAVSTGHIVNLVTSDVQILERVTIFLTQVFIAPILLILTAAFSYYEIGAWSFPGIIVLLLLAPVQGWMGRNFAILRHKTATMTDLRFKIMNEVISGMRVIKMYNWEAPFSNLVADVRKKEVKVIKKTADLKGLNGILYNICIPFIGLIVFVPYVMVGNSLTPEKVFTVLGLFYAVRVSLTIFFPECVRGIKEGMVSCARIQKFLELDDKKPLDGKEPGTENVQPIVEVKNITAQWNMALNAPTIKDLSFTVNPGELFMVVGPVGAGKSSLLLSLLGELPVIQGTIQVKGQMSYASQQSWIFSGTIRENILFGQEYDEARYKKVVKACALEKDFTLFPNEDDTMVGERGVALSGGQKARINLARASYFPSDIILLDDPLSAVDTHVGKQLFEECVRGLLRSRITILVTHQLQYLKGATMILCLQDGRCVGQGTLEDLSERGLDVVSLMSMTSLEHEPTTAEEHTEHEDDVIIMNGKTPLIDKKALMDKRTLSVQSDRTEICLRQSQCDIAMGLSRESLMPNDEEEVEKIAMKPDAEKQTTGTVTWKVYWDYFRAGSSVFGLFVISMLVIIAQSIILVSEWWLAEWADREDYNTKRSQNSTTPPATLTAYSRKTYITVYGIFVAAGLVFSGLSSVSLFRMFVAASQTLHNNMFRCVLRTPIYFFDTNPVGRVLNRFAKDISQMDDLLPSAFFDFIRLSLLTFAILLLNVASIPYLLVGAVPMVLGFGYLRNYYLRTSRDIKRLEAINRSPVYSHISASLHGLITIRAYEAQKRFITTFYDYLDFHSASYFLFLTTQRWLGYRLDMICASFMLFSVVGSLVTLETGTAISASVVGLCLIYAKMLTGMFQWCTRQSAEVENLMTSVERVVEYSHLEPESEPSKPVTIPRDWPEHGVITAEKVYYTHHKTLPFVLKDLNFEIKAEEKIGIVGRTGAGKSSLLGMLFRLNVPEGLVRIDSLPITDMKLHDLRSAIAIIPQDPVLFSGTLRKNLDPFGNYTDEDLWNSLEEVQLKEAIDDLPDGIETHLAEGGSNFSVGQRQLICLARAILSHNKILVIDEATANVDHSTDTLIQETIRNKFKDCTVLTIAHRLNTIMDSDRVMVLDEGRLVEFDEPYLLLKRKHGVFTQLVEQTGVNTAAMLKETARQAYELRHDDALQDVTSQDITFPDASLQDVTVENAMSQNIKEDVTSPGVAPEDASSQGVLEDITSKDAEQDDVTHKDVTQDVTPKDVTQDVASKDVTQQTDNNTPDIVIETAPDHGSIDSRVDDDDDDKSDADHSDDHSQDVNNRDNMVDDDNDDDNGAHSRLIKSGDRGDDDNNTR